MAQLVASGEWSVVLKKLAAERLKLKVYDATLLSMLGSACGRKILDYGAGPGVLASALSAVGAQVKCFDISLQMCDACAKRIGKGNVLRKASLIPAGYFDAVVCNLVLCIVDESEVKRIAANIFNCLSKGGFALVGFCNPRLFDLPESNLDCRFATGESYANNHEYLKVKKEGGYEIVEIHRPTEWYEKVFVQAGFRIEETAFTPQYEVAGRKVNDFVIFKLSK